MSFLEYLPAAVSTLQAGANWLSQERTNEQNMQNVQFANAMSSSIAQENRDFSYKMWKEQTAYNSPVAQMQRLKEAGLNPNLVYGQIAESKMSNPPSIPTPSFDAAHLEAPQMKTNPVAEYQQIRNLQQMNELRNSEIISAKANAVRDASNAEYTAWENKRLMESGGLKSDPSLLKLFNRGVQTAGELLKAGTNKLNQGLGGADRARYILNPFDFRDGRRPMMLPNPFPGR